MYLVVTGEDEGGCGLCHASRRYGRPNSKEARISYTQGVNWGVCSVRRPKLKFMFACSTFIPPCRSLLGSLFHSEVIRPEGGVTVFRFIAKHKYSMNTVSVRGRRTDECQTSARYFWRWWRLLFLQAQAHYVRWDQSCNRWHKWYCSLPLALAGTTQIQLIQKKWYCRISINSAVTHHRTSKIDEMSQL